MSDGREGPSITCLDAEKVLALFRHGHDTTEIARILRISEARAYSLLIRSRG